MKKPVDSTFDLVGDQIFYKGMNVTRDLVSGDLHKAMNSTGKRGGVLDGARDESQTITPPHILEKSLTYSGHPIRKKYKFQGLPISIENPAGSFREGTDPDGHPWRSLIHFDYGYIRGTVGNDKDHVDCFIGHDRNSANVYIIHQKDIKTGKFDEDKIMLGWQSKADALRDYLVNYDRTDMVMGITAMSMVLLKEKLKATKLKPGMIKKSVVKQHLRRDSKTGKISFVQQHTDSRSKKVAETKAKWKSGMDFVKTRLDKIGSMTVPGTSITHHSQIAGMFHELRNDAREKLYYVGLDEAEQIIHVDLHSMGALSSSSFDPKLFLSTLKAAGVKSFYSVHNHPSGKLSPSNADHMVVGLTKELTQKLGIVNRGNIIVAGATKGVGWGGNKAAADGFMDYAIYDTSATGSQNSKELNTVVPKKDAPDTQEIAVRDLKIERMKYPDTMPSKSITGSKDAAQVAAWLNNQKNSGIWAVTVDNQNNVTGFSLVGENGLDDPKKMDEYAVQALDKLADTASTSVIMVGRSKHPDLAATFAKRIDNKLGSMSNDQYQCLDALIESPDGRMISAREGQVMGAEQLKNVKSGFGKAIVVMLKSTIKAHQRKTKSGKIVNVKQHSDNRSVRAKVGGEKGVNGYWYKGGQWLPSNPTGEPGLWKKGKGRNKPGSRELVSPGKIEAAPSPYSRSLLVLAGVGQYTRLDPSTNKLSFHPKADPKDLHSPRSPGIGGVLYDTKISIKDIVEQYNKGQRWLDLNPDAKPPAEKPMPVPSGAPDILQMLLGDVDPELQAKWDRQEADRKARDEEFDLQIMKLESDIKDWQSRKYQTSNKKVIPGEKYDDIHTDEVSVSHINEMRRRSRIQMFSKQIQNLKAWQKWYNYWNTGAAPGSREEQMLNFVSSASMADIQEGSPELRKSVVKQHQRRTKSGKLVQVKQHTDNRSKKPPMEHAWLLDYNTGEQLDYSNTPDPNAPRELDGSQVASVDLNIHKHDNTAMTHIHTHPDNTWFSDADWRVFGNSNLRRMQVVLQDKTVVTVTKPEKMKPNEAPPVKLKAAWEAADAKVFGSLKESEKKYGKEVYTAKWIIEQINRTVAADLGWEISTSVKLPKLSTAQTAAASTDSKEFKSWFKGSKIVNKDGSPMVVHHGTPKAFDKFDPEKQNTGSAGKGFYFAPSKKSSEFYLKMAQKRSGDTGGEVMEVYLSIKNPLVFEDYANIPITKINQQFLKDQGYDGIIVKRNGDIMQGEIIAFDPSQIKSATGNDGSFDPNSDSINKSIVKQHQRKTASGKIITVKEHSDARTKKQDDPKQPRRAAQPDQPKMRVRARVEPSKGRKQAKPDDKQPKSAPKEEIRVKILAAGAGHTKGVFEDAAGNVYKHSMTLGQRVHTGGESKREAPVKTDEHQNLQDLQDLRGVPRVGEMVNTSEGTAFQIERLNDVEPGTMSYDDYKAIESVLEQVNRRGIRYGDIGAPMRRDNGELVLADFSAAHKPEDGKPLGSYNKDLVQNVITQSMLSPEAIAEIKVEREERLTELLSKFGKKGKTVKELKAAIKEDHDKKKFDSPEFKKWFGNSVVVNEDGSPKEVYHGSEAKFSSFDPEHLGEGHDQYGSGHYFTSLEHEAKGYGENVVPAFLSIQKPLDYLSKEPVTKDQIRKLLQKTPDKDALWNFGDIGSEGRDAVMETAVGLYGERTYTIQNLNEISNDFYNGEEEAFLKTVKDVLGYDGVVADFEGIDKTYYIAFDGGQIKHSKDNSGAFDPEDPDFRKGM